MVQDEAAGAYSTFGLRRSGAYINLQRTVQYRLVKQDLAGKVIIVKNPVHAKCLATMLLQDARYLPGTLDAKFFSASIRRLKQNFNANIGANRGTFAAQDECTVQRHVRGEATLGVRGAVIPMKNDWQLETVSYCGSALQPVFENRSRLHKTKPTVRPASSQEAKSLKSV